MQVDPFGVVIVLFGFCGLAVTRWVLTRRRAGRALPRMLRTWEVLGRLPRVAVAMACCEIILGGMIAARFAFF